MHVPVIAKGGSVIRLLKGVAIGVFPTMFIGFVEHRIEP